MNANHQRKKTAGQPITTVGVGTEGFTNKVVGMKCAPLWVGFGKQGRDFGWAQGLSMAVGNKVGSGGVARERTEWECCGERANSPKAVDNKRK